MEQKRLLLAIGLSFLVFFVWSITFAPKPSETPTEQTLAQKPAESPAAKAGEGATPAPAATPAQETTARNVEASPVDRAAREIVVDTRLYRMTLSEQGGAVKSMVLKNYRETVEKDSPLKELIPEGTGSTVISSFGAESGSGGAQALYTAGIEGNKIDVQGQPQELRFTYASPSGIRIEKTYRFSPESYLIDLKVQIQNQGSQAVQGVLKLGLRHPIPKDASSYGFQGPLGLIDGSLKEVKIKDIEKEGQLQGNLHWIAIEEHYFMESLINNTPGPGIMAVSYAVPIVENQLVKETGEIAPGSSYSLDCSIFMGPRSLSVLKAAGNDLDKAINFGWVEIIAKPCLYFMNFIYSFIPNYGIAIIILTIITRLIFWPLATKSYKSMNDMRKLQPLMQEIRQKYKDDKARINQETMALYKTYKINPMGGCLPMLIQLPVFFALYRMLYQAIELRHAPFFGWINDLSAPDRLFHFDFKIPFMTEPYGIPVLTLIMGGTMLLQQKMSPQAGDPTQAKMMMLMPIVFTFIFINFPSGLVLYWLVSNIVSIGQQYYIMKKMS